MKKDGIPSVRTIQRIVASLKAETAARLARDDGSKPCGRFNCPAIGNLHVLSMSSSKADPHWRDHVSYACVLDFDREEAVARHAWCLTRSGVIHRLPILSTHGTPQEEWQHLYFFGTLLTVTLTDEELTAWRRRRM